MLLNREVKHRAAELEHKFSKLGETMEQRIATLDQETREQIAQHFPQVIAGFVEVKERLSQRLRRAYENGAQTETIAAMDEVDTLLDVVGRVIEDGLQGYDQTQTIEDDRLLAAHLSKQVEGEGETLDKVEITFNFEPTDHAEQRVKINYTSHDGTQLSFRIDRAEQFGGVYVDIDTPAVNQAISKGRQKGGHHFRVTALDEMVDSKKFSGLVNAFQELLQERAGVTDDTPMESALDLLKQHFGQAA
jgi:hypothetical protein